jgi:P-type conjugative transfer protein TrbJ
MKKQRFVCALLAAVMAFYPLRARGVIPVFDPSNFSQNILTAIQTLQSNINEAQMIVNQLRNLEALPDDIIGAFDDQLGDLFEIMGTINGLMQDLASLERRFEELYPSFHTSAGVIPRRSLAEESTKWIEHTRAMMLGAAKTGAQVLANLPDRKRQLEDLMGSSQAAVGILQAAQAGNQIAATVSGNLIELNAQLAAYVQAHTAVLMEINESVSASKNRMNYVLEEWEKPYSGNPIEENPF